VKIGQVEHSITVFVCYRRVDGSKYAMWLVERLYGCKVKDPDGTAVSIDTYFDQKAPGISDWKRHHFPSLQTAEVLLVLSTPGIATNLSHLGETDWAYEEINWWVKHRNTSPIVIDCTGEGSRWIPKPIRKRWPNLNWIQLSEDHVSANVGSHSIVVSRILRTIEIGSRQTIFEDLRKQLRLTKRLKIALWLVAFLLIATGSAITFAVMRLKAEKIALNQERVLHQTAVTQKEIIQRQVIQLLFRSDDSDVASVRDEFFATLDETAPASTLIILTDQIIEHSGKKSGVIAGLQILSRYGPYGESAALDEAFSRLFLSLGSSADPEIRAATAHLADILNADRHHYDRPKREPNL